MIALLSVIDAVLIILNPFANAIWLLRLIAGGLVFAGMFLVISAFVVSHRVHRYLQEKEAIELEPVSPEMSGSTADEYAYKPSQEPAYTSHEVYKPEEPVYTQETGYEEPEAQIPEERPVETEIPDETDLPSEENSGGFRGLFKRKKS